MKEYPENNSRIPFPGFKVTGDKPLFELGETYITLNVMASTNAADVFLALCLHATGDWGNVSRAEWQMNDQAVEDGSKIVSEYTTPDGVDFLIVTEADRSETTIMLSKDR